MRWTLILSFLILGGCSMASVAIKNLDWIISRQVKNQLDLYYNQEKKLDIDVTHFLKRQKVQVSPLSNLINELSTELKNKKRIKLQDVEEFRLKMSGFYYKIADDFNANILSKYLCEINAAQLAHFREENTKQNIELKEKISSGESTTFKRIEFFTGDFTPKQQKMLTDILPSIKKLQKLRLKRRKELQIKLYQIIASTKEDKQKTIQTLFYNYVHKVDLKKDPKSLQQFEKDLQKVNLQIVTILNSLSSKQVKTLNEKLKWMQDLLQSFERTRF